MEKIIIKRSERKRKERRATVVVKPEMYKQISDISFETNVPIETIVNMMLEEAIKNIEIV